jgi:hypothetical protein
MNCSFFMIFRCYFVGTNILGKHVSFEKIVVGPVSVSAAKIKR